MGEVFRAYDPRLERDVAVKVLRSGGFSDRTARARLLREARAAAGLNHPNICTVYEVGEADGRAYIAMEFVEGRRLGDCLSAQGLPEEVVLRYGIQISSALEHAHERHIVHRDLKCSNVVVMPDGRVKVLDFGLAKRMAGEELTETMTASQPLSATGAVVGTLAYMAPEQLRGEPADARSDVWALGVLLYELATGKRPFRGRTGFELSSAILTDAPPSLSARIRPELRVLIERCLAKEPGQRYQRAGEVRAALEVIQSGAAAVGEPVETFEVAGPGDAALTASAHSEKVHRAKGEIPMTRRRSVGWNGRVGVVGWRGIPGRGLAVGALLVLFGGVFFWAYRRATHAPPATPVQPSRMPSGDSRPSIAVLPFVDMSPDKDQEYFSDGVAEELLNLLATVPQLRVISRSSAFSFKGREVEVSEIARRLQVAHVLEGSVRKSGDRVRIAAQLIDARSDTQLWSQTWDRQLDDIFAVQDEIATAVVERLKIKLLREAPEARAVSPPAYALFLQAREVGRRGTPEGWAQSNALYQQALALEPGYAPAWSGLADNYMNQVGNGLRPMAEGVPLAREAVRKALALDPSFAPAHGSLGWIAMGFDGDLAAAARHFKHALELAPANTDLLRNAATVAQHLGRLDTAMALGRYVVTQDPIDPRGYHNLGTAQYYAGRMDESIASMRSALRLAPGHVSAQSTIGAALLAKGAPNAALVEIQKETNEIWRLIHLPMAYHALGRKAESDAAVAELIGKYEKDAPYNIAYVLAYRGEADLAFAWLDKAVANGDPGLLDIAIQPEFANIRNDPRWLPFMRKLGRAPEQLAAIPFEVKPPR